MNHTELKRLAEAAKDLTPSWPKAGEIHWQDVEFEAVDAAYIAAASPDVVLSMVAEIDRLRTQNQALLEALKGLQKQYAEHPDAFWDWSQARAAIKLAEGNDV